MWLEKPIHKTDDIRKDKQQAVTRTLHVHALRAQFKHLLVLTFCI